MSYSLTLPVKTRSTAVKDASTSLSSPEEI